MTRHANEYERADHYRDLAKHDDTPPLYAQSAPITGALEVAILAKAVPLQAAADLIEQYARTCASAARLDAISTTIDRCCDAINAHGKERTDA
jgi:hypothetical protein